MHSGDKEHGLVCAKEVVYMYSLVSEVLLLELRRFVMRLFGIVGCAH